VSRKGTDRFQQVGVDRLIRLEWLERTALLVLAGTDSVTIKLRLQNDLKAFFRSQDPNVRGSIDKTITILNKVWLRVPVGLEALRDDGLNLLGKIPPSEHIAVHWGMVMAVYPFWAGVAAQTGRLLDLQGSAAANHIQRRMQERFGERETVSRRTRYVLRSFVDWNVLVEAEEPGVYRSTATLSVSNSQLVMWLVEAYLHTKPNCNAALSSVIGHPSLFPFYLKGVVKSMAGNCDRVEIVRHGLDEDVVSLRK